jgi:hypothetical protein
MNAAPAVCWKCGKNWAPRETGRYLIDVGGFPACADEQECNGRAAIAGLLLLLADPGDGTTTRPPAPRLAAVPDLAASDAAAPRRLTSEEQIVEAAIAVAKAMPRASEDRLRRVAQALSAALQQNSGSEGDRHPS